jgi:serine/threonine-protein kinase
LPFTGDSPVVVAYKRVAEDVPSAMSINPGVPRELDVIIGRATAREATGRFGTAGAMADELRDMAPRSDTGDIGGLVHHTQAIPIVGEETIAVERLKKSGAKRARSTRGKSNLRRPRWLALLILLAVIAATIYVVANRTPSILVPNVKNVGQTQAIQLLQAKGFKVNVRPQNDDVIEAGTLISQDPAPGTKLAKGGTVTLVYSIGPILVTVPKVIGMKIAGATDLLKQQGFVVSRISAPSDIVEKGRVSSQDPGPNVSVKKGETITLTVSTGKELIPVPNVVGQDQDPATNALQNAGFTVTVTQQTDDKIPAGKVISTSPAAAARVAKGTSITMTVSTGPPPVKVPNLLCMTRAQAQDALTHAGLKANFQGLSGSNKKVVDQSPVAGSDAPKGSSVNVVMGYGSTC